MQEEGVYSSMEQDVLQLHMDDSTFMDPQSL